MPDWLSKTIDSSSTVAWDTLLIRLIASLVLGLMITAIYNNTRYPSGSAGTFPTTLVLLCVLIAMVTQVIGDNVARAFSLVGALSIVRFRTVVRDTKDTAFVIFAVVVGMAVGAGQPVVAVCGMAVVGLAAALLRDRPLHTLPFDRETLMTVRLNWSQALETSVLDVVARQASEIEPVSVVTVRNGAATELCFRLRLLPTAKPTLLVAELNRIEGVQTIELHAQRSTT
jgi:hypothetical protein